MITAHIYCIYSLNCDLLYIGSTTRDIYARYVEHLTGKTLSSLRLIKNFGNCNILLLETFKAKTKKEIYQKEESTILALIDDGAKITNLKYPTNQLKKLPYRNFKYMDYYNKLKQQQKTK